MDSRLGQRDVGLRRRSAARELQPIIEGLCKRHGLDHVLIGMEPASYFWELAAESFEAAGLEGWRGGGGEAPRSLRGFPLLLRRVHSLSRPAETP